MNIRAFLLLVGIHILFVLVLWGAGSVPGSPPPGMGGSCAVMM